MVIKVRMRKAAAASGLHLLYGGRSQLQRVLLKNLEIKGLIVKCMDLLTFIRAGLALGKIR